MVTAYRLGIAATLITACVWGVVAHRLGVPMWAALGSTVAAAFAVGYVLDELKDHES